MGEFWNTGRMVFDDVAGMADAALELRRFVVSPFSTNCYAVVSCGKAMVVDPGAEGARIAEALSDVDVELVVATHGHADHVGGVAALVAATGARFAISAADADLARHARRAHAFGIEYDDDAPEPDELLVPGGTTGVGEARFRVVATPGHTPGGVTLVVQGTAAGLAFVGDTLFAGSAGRTDLAGGDPAALLSSLGTLSRELPGETHVLTGHGDDTTIGWELRSNPYLQAASRARA